MANRRREPKKSKRESRPRAQRPRVPHEVLAVILGCLGVLTILSLLSYHAGDASLNASGSSVVKNWIGPAGAYWSDLLLQMLGIGAYALGVALILAGFRALTARRITPGARELFGLLLTVVTVGTLTHLVTPNGAWPYSPGGLLGALLGDLLREELAMLGALVVTSASLLVSLTLLVDGIIAGLGKQSLCLVRKAFTRGRLALAGMSEHRRRLRERRLELEDEREAQGYDEPEVAPSPESEREEARQRLCEVRAKAAAAAEQRAEREAKSARRRATREERSPLPALDDTIDLVAEEEFELGALPDFLAEDRAAREAKEPEELAVPVVAALPDLAEPRPAPEELAPAAPPPSPDTPKRVLKRSKTSEPQIVDVRHDLNADAIAAADREGPRKKAGEHTYTLPSPALLDFEATVRAPVDPQKLRENALRLTKTLKDYGIEGHIREIRPGPVVTMYEYVPAPGIKLSKIASLADDLAMSMEAFRVRIVAPIPGKGAVGIEIPNEVRETVFLKEIIAHDTFKGAKSPLALAVGKDIEGGAYVTDLTRMPHLLVAGATGAGKSVSINTMIMSVLFRSTPDEVRMIMVDPKMLELSVYDGVPHLLLPVVTDPKKAALALRWAVEEMERRYQLLSETGVRGIDGYNKNIRAAIARGEKLTLPAKNEGEEPRALELMPYLMVIVDELADLMMVASRDVEASIMRLAQMARAAGIHLILATQRPSVDVITGVIKANFPTRISFQVASRHDSRTILDSNGAEHLLGRGDMLFLSPGAGGIVRVHGAYVSEEEIARTVGFWKEQGVPEYDESILQPRPEAETDGEGAPSDEVEDEAYRQAIAIVTETRQASISMIQRRLRIGYNRAARLVERMESEGIVGRADGAKPREVLLTPSI